jgi:hypothetical protein
VRRFLENTHAYVRAGSIDVSGDAALHSQWVMHTCFLCDAFCAGS